MERPVENKLKTSIDHSGNSDVDLAVNIDIDTKPIAYGILCSLFAKGELSESELEKAIRKLDSLIERDKKRRKSNNDTRSEARPKLFETVQQKPRRNWI
jgi:hypothetical protein